MPPMRYAPFVLPLCLPLGGTVIMILVMMGGCHDKAPSTDPESANPIVPPFASGLLEEPKETELLQLHPVGGGQTPGQAMDPMAAIQQARERVNNNPQDLEALIFLGNAYYDIQHYQEAADLYQKALELNSDNAQVRTDRATALYRLGRPKEAIDELTLALASDDHHENALYNLGMIKLTAFNDRKGAIDAWTQLIGMTQDQQLIADLDKRLTALRQPPGTASAEQGAMASATPPVAGPPGSESGAAQQLPQDHPK
jgi:Flp pilus assembly protein TadD